MYANLIESVLQKYHSFTRKNMTKHSHEQKIFIFNVAFISSTYHDFLFFNISYFCGFSHLFLSVGKNSLHFVFFDEVERKANIVYFLSLFLSKLLLRGPNQRCLVSRGPFCVNPMGNNLPRHLPPFLLHQKIIHTVYKKILKSLSSIE